MPPPVAGSSSMAPEGHPPLNTYVSYLEKLKDPQTPENVKLEAAQELSENFDLIVTIPQYPSFLDTAVKIFLRILQDGEPHFIAEYNSHQIRKLLLEMIHRIPTNKYLKPHVDSILSLVFKLLKIENEQIVLVCLRIIIELHKHKRPVYNDEIKNFLHFIRSIYQDLSNHVNRIFEPKSPIHVKDISELDLNSLLTEIYTMTPVHCEKILQDGSISRETYNLIPRGIISLKVLQELPIINVQMYELYKENVKNEMNEYIPIIIQTITLQPDEKYRLHESFNKEVFVDFLGAQIKTLSFLAYMIRVYQEAVEKHAELMVKGILGMLTLCPMEVTSLRKDLLVAARIILATDLRLMFVPYMNQLFDEDILLGRGCTTHDSLRPLAYTTLADLVHNVKQQLKMSDLVKAVHLFSKNVHDETLPTNIQTVSCKVLVNLVDCIRQQTEKDPTQLEVGRDLFLRMIEVFVLKFKTIAKLQLPILIAKSKQVDTKNQAILSSAGLIPLKKEDAEAAQTSGPNRPGETPSQQRTSTPVVNYSVADCRNLVKTLVCGVKTISWRFKLCKPRETELFIRLVKWALQALDIYTLSMTPMGAFAIGGVGMRVLPQQAIRAKGEQNVRAREEKEVLEHFSGVFSVMNAQTFREIFSTSIEYMVDRIANNFALQTIGNSFLTNAETSPIFVTVLLEYLLSRMEEMGNGNIERSNLYLKLFKLVFGSVSLYRSANEQMLRPHIHQIVNRSVELAMTAKEPYNYFLLLRTLFKCIGDGNHDLLHKEFLPLLPSLLQGLNSFQSGLHKQHMKDLFVELCLTVPVRLSSLLSYLPMLMDPLVSALNGSPTLVSQGLRTLELCVDNLHTEFLNDNIQPVRADLMQALWRSLRNPMDQVSHVAFRLLGKFGGGNRKMMIVPQKLEYRSDNSPEASIVVQFLELNKPIELPIVKVIETSVSALRLPSVDIFYRRKAWEIIRDYLLISMEMDLMEINQDGLVKLLTHSCFKDYVEMSTDLPYKCPNSIARQTCINALTGMFYALAVKDLASEVQPFFEMVLKQFTILAVCQQVGPYPREYRQTEGIDPLVVVEAIAVIMGNEEKEFCKIGKTALGIIIDTSTLIMGSKDGACRLPLMEYIAEKMYSLCYNRAWYTKLGGCIAIMYLLESLSLRWVYQHLFVFVKAQLFVMMDLTGEISSGAIDQAKSNLKALMELCAPPVNSQDEELVIIQKSALKDVIVELNRQITSPTDLVREQAMFLLKLFARVQNKTVYEVMEPHKKILADMVLPKKQNLRHLTLNAQIGLMEGNTFCYTLTPRLFTEEEGKPTSEERRKKEKEFFDELTSLFRQEDASLLKMSQYKNVSSLVPLRKAAMRALAAGYFIPGSINEIFDIFYQILKSSNQELQEAAFESMKTFVHAVDINLVLEKKDALLMMADDNKIAFTLSEARRLTYLVQLFPECFQEKLCDQHLRNLQAMMAGLKATPKKEREHVEKEQIVATVVSIFHQMPAAGPKFIEPLTYLVLQTERNLLVGANSPFRLPLLKFLLRYPQQTITLLLADNSIKDDLWNKFLEYLIKHKEGKSFRDVLQSPQCVQRLIALAKSANSLDLMSLTKDNKPEQLELRFQSARIVSLLVKHDVQWLSNQHQLAQTYIDIWCNDSYQARHSNVEEVEYCHWKEPKLIVKILLNYFSHHPSNILLLFQLLRAFCYRYIPDFRFVKDFLEKTVAQSYTVEWKRMAFFKFVELFPSEHISQELKAKILQFIIIPCFNNCFERGEGDKLIGGPPSPSTDSPDNIVSVFISKIIDPENPFAHGDAVRILLLQLSCIFVEQALAHFHEATKTQSVKLKRIMTYAWPCLLSNNCADPATRYHGHLLLSHIIAKMAFQSTTYKRVVLQVFHTLLKAHAVEVRQVVRQALDILTPALPARMEDGYTMLTHWTKKIIVEEGHSMQQLFHILQLVVRQYNIYYPVRHSLLQHMVSALQRLGLSASSNIEHKRLGCELAEVIIQWEARRMKEKTQLLQSKNASDNTLKRSAPGEPEVPFKKGPGVSVMKPEPEELRPLEKSHADILINFLMRLACSANDANPNPAGIASQGEIISRRCCNLIRQALNPDFWPQYDIDFRLTWMNNLFCSLELAKAENTDKPMNKPNLGNICMGLELLTMALTVMEPETVKANCKILQKGINVCIASTNNKVITLTRALLTKLMSIFPTEPSNSPVSSKYEELECIYSSVGQVIVDGINNYEKNTPSTSSCLFGTIMLLNAACSSNPSYVDRLINPFVRAIHRMSREHLTGKSDSTPSTSDLLIWSLELVKNRIGIMQPEAKKTFIGSILVGLIENTQDIKVMKAICKMVEEWVKNTKSALLNAPNMGPSLREKSILLVKLMQHVEERFPDLVGQFLELVNFIYRDDAFNATELIPKLEPAFLAGLRCTDPRIRAKFFEIFDGSMRRRLSDRLMYIMCSQNWELMGHHYWIKQCIELLLVTADDATLLQLSSKLFALPSLSTIVQSEAAREFLCIKAELVESDVERNSNIAKLIQTQCQMKESKHKLTGFLSGVAQLCHMDSALAERVWLDLFPRLWSILTERQRTSLSEEISLFIVSGCHVGQKDDHPSALSTFFESLAHCQPPLQIKPAVMSYLGKSHNLWHRVTLILEKTVAEQWNSATQNRVRRDILDSYDFEPVASPNQADVEYLAEMYSQLKEDDMWCALWQKHARYKETSIALAYEQQGFFEQALGGYELAMTKGKQDYSNSPAPVSLLAEQRLWEKQWIKCSKELNQWNHLLDYAKTKGNVNPFLVLESAWRVPDWPSMKEAIAQVETACPKEIMWKVHLHRGYLCICHPQDKHLAVVERYVQLSSSLCLREWRRLPHIVSHMHIPLLQAAQQIRELQEAHQIHQGLVQENANYLHDMKSIVKTWRNRLPVISDDLSHWSDILCWRQHHYQTIAKRNSSPNDPQSQANSQTSIYGVHESVQALIHFGKIARKHNLINVCEESLARIHTINEVPVVDCFQNVRQQVKCHLHKSATGGTADLQKGLGTVESIRFNFFTKEMTAEMHALKGMLLAQLGRTEEAEKTFSAAASLYDLLVKTWALWGDFCESQFIKSQPPDISLGVGAITCFLHACRHQNESKSRKYLAKVLWLLTYDDKEFKLTQAVDKYVVGVPAIQWLPWIPQLLTCLTRDEGELLHNLLSQVGKMFPQAVYFPLRTLYFTLKIKQIERDRRNAELLAAKAAKQPQSRQTDQAKQGPPDITAHIFALPPMKRSCRMIKTLRDTQPTVLTALEGIIDQMVWFRESWYEEVLRQLRQALAKCYAIAFEHRKNIRKATITTHTLHFVETMVSVFGIGINENVTNQGTDVVNSASESLAKRAEATKQDPVFQEMKKLFSQEFEFKTEDAKKLQNLIFKLKKWIKKLEAKTKLLPKSFLIEEKARFFSLQSAEIELPGEFLFPKHSHYYVKISRFLPRVEIVHKHNTAARTLFIRGHNGKVYPYLVLNDSGLADARREERVLQLLRMLNHYFGKQKETSRRFLNLTVPRVVAVSPQMRLVEDNRSSTSLLDIYKESCLGLGIEHDAPVTKYYESLASLQDQGLQMSHQVLKDILKDIQTTMIPKTLLKDWALRTYPSPTDFWTFRKMFTLQMALACFCEYVLHLTRLNPDMLYVHQDSGLINVSYFKFDVDDTKCELEANRYVPFRLTPNIQELITETGIIGPLTASMIACARCLVYPNFKVTTILRAILRDEMIFAHRKRKEDVDNLKAPPDAPREDIIRTVTHAVDVINQRLNSLANFDVMESKVSPLVAVAKSTDNLCLMDPAWHPWF